MTDTVHRLLLVDDDAAVISAITRELRQGVREALCPPLKIDAFTDPMAALAHACQQAFSLAICDYRMPGMNGVELLSALREQQPECNRIILSGQTDQEGLIDAINKARISRFMAKPWVKRELLYAVRQFLLQHEQALELQQLADQQRFALGQISAQEAECRRLERLEPGITHVNLGSDGSYLLDPAR